MDWAIVLLVAAIIFMIAGDKIITAINIHTVAKNFPNLKANSIEKNPLAKLFFDKFGTTGGSVIYFFISIVTACIAVALLSATFYSFGQANPVIKSMLVILVVYTLVVIWNFYMYLRFAKIISP
jgi:hypothetical protein